MDTNTNTTHTYSLIPIQDIKPHMIIGFSTGDPDDQDMLVRKIEEKANGRFILTLDTVSPFDTPGSYETMSCFAHSILPIRNA